MKGWEVFEVNDRMIHAILTGDIVDSTGLRNGDMQPASNLIAAAGESLKSQFPGAIHAQVDIFRGDSWQMVVLDPGNSVRIGLYFRSYLKSNFGIDSRVSIGFGPVDHLPKDNISTGTGLAFTLSGQGLLECVKPVRMNISLPDSLNDLNAKGLNTVIRLIDLQAGRWTQSQSQAIAGALTGLTQSEIASGWLPEPISQQAISQHLDNAGWSQIKDALDYLEETLPLILIP
jgi:hypothetical protein